MESGKRVLTAMALMAVALSVTAYATAIGGASAVSTDEISVIYRHDDTTGLKTVEKFPTKSAIEENIGTITLGNLGNAGLAENDNIRVGFELILDDPDIYKGLKSFVVEIGKASGGSTTGVVALLTPNTVYDEVIEELYAGAGDITYNVKVIAAAGHKKLTDVSFRVRATAMVENMA